MEDVEGGREESEIAESAPSCHRLQVVSKLQLSEKEQFCVVGRRTNSMRAALSTDELSRR